MALEDVFGASAAYHAQKSWEDKPDPVTPLDDVSGTDATPIRFDGFSSGRPWYVDKPTRYLGRMNAAANLLLRDTENGPALHGMLVSPILSLPCPGPDERYEPASDDAYAYPLIDIPVNAESFGDPDIDMLAWVFALTDMGLMMETEDGSIICYELEDEYECDPELWKSELQSAVNLAPLLLNVNLARFILFAMMDRHAETETFTALFDLWGLGTDNDTIHGLVKGGVKSGWDLAIYHGQAFPDIDDHDPFSEFRGFAPYEQVKAETEREGDDGGKGTPAD